MVLSANDVADAQIDIVGTRREVVSGHAIGTEQRKVFDIIGGFDLLAIDGVIEANLFAGTPRDTEAESERFSGGGAAIALGARKFAHSGIKEPGLIRAGFFAFACMSGGEVAVCQAFLKDGVGYLAMQTQALGLPVLFVPPEIEPAQPLENGVHGSVGIALDIGVIEAEDHGSSIVAGVKPVEDEGASTANVQKTSGRRGEANAEHNFRV
jgi:hypothetical protein